MKREEMGYTLIGSYTARFDKSGRIKIPEKFRMAIEEKYGKDLFITSLTNESVQIYPLPVWEKMSRISRIGAYHIKPAVRKFMLHVNKIGNHYQIDSKGRILVSQLLREQAKLEDEVLVVGMTNHLEVWNKNLLDVKLQEMPLTHEDFDHIAALLPQEEIE